MPKFVDHSLPKPCKTCGLTLAPEAFRRALAPGSAPDARKTECKTCADERLRQWREKNPNRVASYKGKYKVRENASAKAYSKKEVQALSVRYVRKMLRWRDAPPELIETKRAQVQLIRLIKEKETT